MYNIIKSLSKISQVGITMVVTIGLCFFIKKWLDEKRSTNIIFLAIFTLLGIGAGFRNVYILIMKDYKEEEKREQQQRDLDYKNVKK